MDFQDKICLITGASRGIGRAIAIAFAKAGAKVILNFRKNEKAAQAVFEEMEGEGHLLFQADVADPVQVEKMIEDVVKHFGRLDIVVNNAGIVHAHPIDEVDYSIWQTSWDEILQTNLLGAANVCYCAVQHMILQKGGRIVNVSSRGAFRGEPEHPAYGASKAGLNSMSQSLAKRLAPHNIFVGVVAPGFVETDMGLGSISPAEAEALKRECPLQRMARPEEVAKAVLFLASEGTDYLTGAILDVNGASYLRS